MGYENMVSNKFALPIDLYETKDIIFVWVPKCAGESVYSALKEYGCRRLVTKEEISTFDNQGCVTFVHANIENLKNNGFIDEDYYNRAFKFGIVRNPWDRHVSLYFWLLKHCPKELRGVSFDDFCKPDIMKTVEPDEGHPDEVKQLRKVCAQSDWLFNGSRTQCLVDLIMRVESLEWEIKTNMGIDIGHRNSTSHNYYSKYYTDYTRDAIGEFYKEDIDRFGYEFTA
jgi:hypothetical protein